MLGQPGSGSKTCTPGKTGSARRGGAPKKTVNGRGIYALGKAGSNTTACPREEIKEEQIKSNQSEEWLAIGAKE